MWVTSIFKMDLCVKHQEELRILSSHLEAEKKKTETLLYAMLPRHVANQLKEGKKVEAGTFMLSLPLQTGCCKGKCTVGGADTSKLNAFPPQVSLKCAPFSSVTWSLSPTSARPASPSRSSTCSTPCTLGLTGSPASTMFTR